MNDLSETLSYVVHDNYLIILILFIAVDIITGTLQAFKNGTVYSKINKSGITKHVSILLFCIFFSWMFNVFKLSEYSKLLVIFYIVSYGLSIFENLGKMGVPLPQWLSSKFKLLHEEVDKGEQKNEIKKP